VGNNKEAELSVLADISRKLDYLRHSIGGDRKEDYENLKMKVSRLKEQIKGEN
jgi:hypothetical protein